MLKIGLTGGIGSGKSSVGKLFKKWGAYIFNADAVAKDILQTNESAQNEIISEFGTDVIDKNGMIDRTKLARVAFQDEIHQLKLNTIIHPFIFKTIDKTFDEIKKQNKNTIFVVDAALIYESAADTHMDYVIVVTSQLRIRIERVLNRGGLTRDEFLRRVDLQWPEEDKVNMADYVINNNGSEEELAVESKNIYSLIT